MGNRRDREEKIMKKLAIIGIVFASVLLWAATAQAKPTGMSQAEYQALNQKYGVEPQQAALRVRLEEIGAWAVPSTSKQMPLAHQPGQPTVGEQLREIGAWAVPSTSKQMPLAHQPGQPTVGEQLREIGAWAVPSTSKTTVVASSSGEFDWNNAGIGAALVLGVAVFGAATLLAVRRHYHKPVAY
jgi:arginine repressor